MIQNMKSSKRVKSKHNKRRKNNNLLLSQKDQKIKERLTSANTFKLTGLNPSQKSSITHELSESNI